MKVSESVSMRREKVRGAGAGEAHCTVDATVARPHRLHRAAGFEKRRVGAVAVENLWVCVRVCVYVGGREDSEGTSGSDTL